MSHLSIFALIAYILSVAATQTIYGGAFLTYRWYALFAFVAAGGADWVLARVQKRTFPVSNCSDILVIYLMATGVSVVFAENWQFSGMRWASHAIMLVAFMVFLRQIAGLPHVRLILLLLKLVSALLLLISWIAPAKPTLFEDLDFYRGAMGDSNTMGHIAVVCALVFFHALMTSRKGWPGYLQGAMALSAMATVWSSGARSSMVALISGLALMSCLYRERMRGVILWGFIAASVSALAFPELPQKAMQFAVKREEGRLTFAEQAIQTRKPLWVSALEGYRKRPLFGWGFGADSDIGRSWDVKLTALGTVRRDAVNDFLFMMEGCGTVGIVAYAILIFLVIRQMPSRRQRQMLRWYKPHQQSPAGEGDISHTHAVLSVLSISILVLNQFDGSALSAGSFTSAVLWLSASSAGALLEREHLRERSENPGGILHRGRVVGQTAT